MQLGCGFLLKLGSFPILLDLALWQLIFYLTDILLAESKNRFYLLWKLC